MIQVSPSVLSADFTRLGNDIEMLNGSEADYIHIDVMDGVFVPNISFGFPVMKAISRIAAKPLDVHLMITDPARYVNEVKDCGGDIMTVHIEACTHLHRVVQQIKQAGMKAGVSLNPATPVCMLADIITDIDLVLLMSVNPGFGGQKFIPNTIKKVHETRALIESAGSHALIEIDGGVNLTTGAQLAEAGADMLVAGNFVFSSDNPQATISALRHI